MDADSFQQQVGRWAEQTFPRATYLSITTHLMREAEELHAASPHGPYGWEVASEAADCYLLLLHLCHRLGFSLQDAAIAKFAHNQKRRWGQPDAAGVVEHIRDTEEQER